MAFSQRPQYEKQQDDSAQQKPWSAHQDQWYSQSNTTSASPLSQPQHFQREPNHQNNHHSFRSDNRFSRDQTTNRNQLSRRPAALHQAEYHVVHKAQPQGSWNGSSGDINDEGYWQHSAQVNDSVFRSVQQDLPNLYPHVGPLRQDHFPHPGPGLAPPKRSYSHEATLGVDQVQFSSSDHSGRGSNQEWPSANDYSRHHQSSGNIVGRSGENRDMSYKKLEKKRIIIEPSSPDTISWDNPFPTFPTGKKKASPHESTSLRNLSNRGVQDQKPHTAGSGKIRSETTREKDAQYYRGAEGKSSQDREVSNGRGMEGVFKQKMNGNYSLPSSPIAAAFPQGLHRSDAPEDADQKQSITHKILAPTQTHPPAEVTQWHPQYGRSHQAVAAGRKLPGTFQLADGHHIGSLSNGMGQGGSHTSPVRQDSFNSSSDSHQASYSSSIPSYYEEQIPMRQRLDSLGPEMRSPSEEDMPDFSVMSLSDMQGTNRRLTEDLHLQPSIGVPAHPSEKVSSRVERGRGLVQESGREFTSVAQRSRSQPGYRIHSRPAENQVKGSYFGTDENLESPLAQTTHQPNPRPHYSHRAPSAETNFSTRSTPTVTSSYSSFNRSGRVDRHPDVPRRPSPATGPGMLSNRGLAYVAYPQRPHDQSIEDSNQNAHKGSVAENESKTMHLPSHNADTLPNHPAPVRLGLLNQAMKPPPIRHYESRASPLSQTNSPPQSSIIPQHSRASSSSLAQADLDQLRQAVQVNPNDMKAQLALAKKMVETSSVLINQDGPADPKQRAKSREKLILDAHKMVKRLVNNGFVEAMFYLADCYGRGLLGLENDLKEAFNLYSSAAKLGHAASAYRVAVCCEMGQDEGGGTRRDPLKAVQWYKRAASLGDTPAMYKMGMIQLKGLLGQPQNPREAIVWLKRAAERADAENPHALHELGLLFESAGRNDNIIRDEAYSLQLFTQAATLGYKFSQNRLGAAYEYGSLGCVIDARQSIAWYSKAAVQEEHQSELALSGWYLTGSEGILQQSDTEAYLWARKAAHAGLAKAEYAMGYFTEVGIGAPANLEDAKRWYWRAASQNFPKARERLEDLRKGGARMEKSRVSRSAVNRGSDGDCTLM